MPKGILLLVSGPSGSGKSTLCRRLEDENEASFSVSCTTRAPRTGEVDKKDYYFIEKVEFLRRIEAGDFIEYAEVHGNYYGTLRSEVVNRLIKGLDVMMDVDVQGAAQVRSCGDPIVQSSLVDLFVMPSSEKELAARLKGRGTDSEDVIALRLKNAVEEMSHWPEYRYRLLSATREEDFINFKALLVAERMRVSRVKT